MKRKIVFLALVSSLTISLVGCSNTEIVTREPAIQQDSVSVAVEETTLPTEEIIEIEVEEQIIATLEATEKSQPTEPQTKESPDITPTENLVAPIEPTQTTNPTETPNPTYEPTQTPESTVTPPPVVTPKPTQVSESEPAFDVAYWVNFAKDYGISIGMKLDSTATGSWDTPIGANAKCIYLERDIKDTLDWYKNDYSYKNFWVWSEQIGENKYNIYIGYA